VAGGLVGQAAEIADDLDKRVTTRLTFRLIHLADIEAVTAGA